MLRLLELRLSSNGPRGHRRHPRRRSICGCCCVCCDHPQVETTCRPHELTQLFLSLSVFSRPCTRKERFLLQETKHKFYDVTRDETERDRREAKAEGLESAYGFRSLRHVLRAQLSFAPTNALKRPITMCRLECASELSQRTPTSSEFARRIGDTVHMVVFTRRLRLHASCHEAPDASEHFFEQGFTVVLPLLLE